jgi:hypothetical protein
MSFSCNGTRVPVGDNCWGQQERDLVSFVWTVSYTINGYFATCMKIVSLPPQNENLCCPPELH